jgi:tetratricopeptide (TPR) repeat protein
VLGEASCIKGLGDIARDRADYDTAQARYERALPLYQQGGSVLGEASCIKGLGDIARDRADYDTAQACYEQALSLYETVAQPYSTGWTHIQLARLHPEGSERLRHWKAARETWANLGRYDLIDSVAGEFE